MSTRASGKTTVHTAKVAKTKAQMYAIAIQSRIYIHATGNTYKGQWHRDQKSGTGSEMWTDGSRYDGEYLRGTKHGQGVYRSADGISYEGQFRSDKMDGDGTYIFTDGRQYTGQWQ